MREAPIWFHSLRHGLATFLINQNVDQKTVSGLLRHARVGTTLDIYAHQMDESKLAAQDLAAQAMIKDLGTVQ